MKRVRTKYRIASPKVRKSVRLAVASDLHSGDYADVTADFAACDAVLIPGDLVDRHRKNNETAFRFLKEIPGRFPVFYSIGNHEVKFAEQERWLEAVSRSGAVLLDNGSRCFEGIRIGGLSSVPDGEEPDTAFLDRLEKEKGFRLLMCHQPEMYRDAVRGRNIDCTVSGHAHGGQIQFFGQGLYAPGQGLFPKLTNGIYDGGKLIVSRGMTNSVCLPVPRINNPCELLILEIRPGDAYSCERMNGDDE